MSKVTRTPEERAILTTLILTPRRWDDVANLLQPWDFSVYGHRLLYETMASQVEEDGTFDVASLTSADERLAELIGDLMRDESPSPGMLMRHVGVVAAAAAAFRLGQRLGEAQQSINKGEGAQEVLDTLLEAVHSEQPTAILPPGYTTFDEWAEAAMNNPRPWVIPGVIRRGSRIVFVAPEGAGKSSLLFQIALFTSAGVHPFRLGRIPPQRVLVIDVETDPAASVNEDGTVNHASPLGIVHHMNRSRPERDRAAVRIWSRPEGIDLRSRRDLAWLEAVIRDHQPDLIVGGPLYKMYRRARGEDDETLSSALQTILDRIRIRYDVALWMEHHAPKGMGGHRPMSPFGSSLWMRWPEIGISATLDEDDGALTLGRFRGDRYRVPGIPKRLYRDRPIPWMSVWDGRQLR